MRIAITGISGFLGKQLAVFFSKENEVFGISTSGFQMEGVAVYNFDQLPQINDPELIIHCHAAVASGQTLVSQQELIDGNLLATAQIIHQFPLAAHLYVSTVAVYGNSSEIRNEQSFESPVTAYAVSKYEAEKKVLKIQKSAILRLASLYGPQMKENTLIPNYVKQALQNGKIEVWGNGERKQNYFHISDAITLINAIIKNKTWNQPIFLGCSDKEFSNLEIATIISDETAAGIVFSNEDQSLSVQYDNSFTQKSLNWQPQMAIDEGIKQYVSWKKRQS